MRWDGLFADLEAQAAALASAERAAEIDEHTRGEVAGLTLVDRLRAAAGAVIRLRLAGGVSLGGTLMRVGPDWLLVEEDGGRDAVVPLAAVHSVRGLNRYSAAPGSTGVVESRLGLRHALRGIARDRSPVRIELGNGSALDATIDRVGADFVEAAIHAAGEFRRRPDVRDVEAVALAAVVAVRRRV